MPPPWARPCTCASIPPARIGSTPPAAPVDKEGRTAYKHTTNPLVASVPKRGNSLTGGLMRLIRAFALTLMTAAVSLGATVAFAQSDGRATGVVRDSSGAAVPGANVTVTNDQTGASQTAVSGPDGTFTVTGLAPGDYTVEVQLRGFGTSRDRKSTRLNSSHGYISYAVFCLKKKKLIG